MSALVQLVILAALAAGVVWLAQRACRALLRPEAGRASWVQALLLLFAWSFVLGALMRWVRLTG